MRPNIRHAARSALAGFLVLALAGIAAAVDVPNVQFGPAPTTLQEARSTVLARRDAVVKLKACGDEIAYMRLMNGLADSPGEILPRVVAKMLWLILNPAPQAPAPKPAGQTDTNKPVPGNDGVKHHDEPDESPLRIAFTVPAVDAVSAVPIPGQTCEHPTNQVEGDTVATNRALSALYDWIPLRCASARCEDPLLNVAQCDSIIVATDPAEVQGFSFKNSITAECMRRQINAALLAIKVRGQLGTDGLPCVTATATLDPAQMAGQGKKHQTIGEWDVTVRDLTRVLYLHRLNKDRNILFAETASHIQDDLLTADGGPGLAGYALYECGNTEYHTGTAQQRLDRRGWLSDTAGDILGGIDRFPDWLKSHLPLPDWLLLALVVLAALFGVPPELLAGLLTAGAALLYDIRIPETENHRLNIETSRYLNNQIIIEDLRRDGADPGPFVDDQENVKSFLMDRFTAVMRNDFSEYNARPYSRYSMYAILNIAQFAKDNAVQESARMVLDYTTAKAAMGLNAGRRLVPFRRHLTDVPSKGGESLFSNLTEGDHLIPMMMLYSGQSQLLNNLVNGDEADFMIFYASTMIDPNHPNDRDPLVMHDVILEAAADKAQTRDMIYEQRIRHAGVEIYSGGDGWVVSAGGIATGPTSVVVAPMFSPKDDFGAAWPTTLLLSATGPDAKPLQDFLRIEGIKLDNGSYDGNLCVGMGFGCGFNIEFPAAVSNPGGIGQPDQSNRFPVPNKDTGEFDPNNAGCLQIAGMWTFFDTATCYPNDTGRGLLRFRRGPQGRRIVEHRLAAGATVAVMRQPCPKGSPAACRNFGFFEVVSHSDPVLRGSADPAQRIATVKERAMKNRSFGIARTETGSALASGVYTTVKERSPNAGHRIAFEAHWFSASFPAKESAMARITSIDGQERSNYPNWNLAEGDFIRGDSQGRVNIGWQTRRDGKSPQIMFLDITDRDFPFRLIPPMFTTGK